MKIVLGKFICHYEKEDHQDFVLKCGQVRLGCVGQNGRDNAWYHLGSSWDTKEAKTCGDHLKMPLSEAKKLLEKEALAVLNSMAIEALSPEKNIIITIEALSPRDMHKCTITPSVAVNPPAIQYFKGVEKNFFSKSVTDDRLQQISSFIITMLSSDEYPTPPVCSKLEATKIAKNSISMLLHRLEHRQKVSRVINYANH